MTTTSATTRQKVTLYNTTEADLAERVQQVILVINHPVALWKKKLFLWIVKSESNFIKSLMSEDKLFRSDIYLPEI